MSKVAAYGSWTSTITPDLFAKGNCKAICELQAVDDGVFWVEQSATTGKRELYYQNPSGNLSASRVRWAPEQSVQNCVHEYGGGSFIPLKDGSVIYSTVDGVFHQAIHDAAPIKLADSSEKKLRFADFSATDTHIYCVNESHLQPGVDPENRLISIDRQTKEQKVVASGADFYASPRVSKDGKRLVWMQWNHVNMPWDETSIHLAVLHDDGTISNEVVIKDGTGKKINYYCPSWSDDKLLMVNDSSNFWNVYEVDIIGPEFKEKNLFPVEREIGYPQWQFDDRPYASNGSCMIMNVGGRLMSRRDCIVKTVPTPGYTVFSHLSITNGDIVYAIAAGPRKASCIIKIDMSKEDQDPTLSVVRTARDDADLESLDISEPERIEFQSDGVPVSALFYSPKNRNFTGLPGTLPPVLLLGHAGPTATATDSLNLKIQFFTSRGFAVLDVNYRGSTGLKGQWGVVDRDDMIAAANSVIARRLVDPEKVCILGSSAGGYLVLAALLHSDVFKAAVSIYGVADLVGLLKDTHKFERGYNEVLIGKYPEDEQIYKDRSPIYHIDRLQTPIAFLHGKEDTVVPVSQSVEMYDKLREKGVTTALMLFDDEGHGFRGPDAVRRSTEASYVFLCKVLGIQPSISSDIQIVNSKK
ncbi:peptidase, S9A/B/C family, catalytic domain protein [Necator americanus]|uniref:Acyl-peptide hydrolase n=1 Tax=Necator americanus TaxID=51031 RepID=W2ST68_NECAM|nr:peptidase, S9A/B/C family, catalytic domain protein [Necator americanus]ETN72800.1 peptidase, S9A/B/C family, catalytic domain protein [Necator americanus]